MGRNCLRINTQVAIHLSQRPPHLRARCHHRLSWSLPACVQVDFWALLPRKIVRTRGPM